MFMALPCNPPTVQSLHDVVNEEVITSYHQLLVCVTSEVAISTFILRVVKRTGTVYFLLYFVKM